jgi:hypothetical protein
MTGVGTHTVWAQQEEEVSEAYDPAGHQGGDVHVDGIAVHGLDERVVGTTGGQ